MKILQSIANYWSLLFFERVRLLLNTFLLQYGTLEAQHKARAVCTWRTWVLQLFSVWQKRMWQSSLWVERSELVFSARMLATQYGELQEVVKLCKSKRLSESQYCLCKHHLNHNTLKTSFFCSHATLTPLVHLSQGFLHIPWKVTPTWPQWKLGCPWEALSPKCFSWAMIQGIKSLYSDWRN